MEKLLLNPMNLDTGSFYTLPLYNHYSFKHQIQITMTKQHETKRTIIIQLKNKQQLENNNNQLYCIQNISNKV